MLNVLTVTYFSDYANYWVSGAGFFLDAVEPY